MPGIEIKFLSFPARNLIIILRFLGSYVKVKLNSSKVQMENLAFPFCSYG